MLRQGVFVCCVREILQCIRRTIVLRTVIVELFIYKQDCKYVVWIMATIVTIYPREPMVRDSATQTSVGKLMSLGPQISIKCRFRDPDGSEDYKTHLL